MSSHRGHHCSRPLLPISCHLHQLDDHSSSWSQTLSLPSSSPWNPLSPDAATWTSEPPRPQSYSSCWHRPSHAHAHTHTHTHLSGAPLIPWWSIPLMVSHLPQQVSSTETHNPPCPHPPIPPESVWNSLGPSNCQLLPWSCL